ncbi:hypothetical protein Hanom_Chr15g01377431 [Helianthus anomalus]
MRGKNKPFDESRKTGQTAGTKMAFYLQKNFFSILELDKVGSKAKSIAGPEFRVELHFGPADPNQLFSAPSDGDDDPSDGGDC